MYKINVIAVGNMKEDFFIRAADEYLKRIGGFCKIGVTQIEEYKLNDESAQSVKKALDTEGKAILKKAEGYRSILLDIAGKELDSPAFSELLMREVDTGELCFIIGSSYGVSEEVKKAVDHRISFGKITLPHRLARIVLLEQIYRGFTIAKGKSYHK